MFLRGSRWEVGLRADGSRGCGFGLGACARLISIARRPYGLPPQTAEAIRYAARSKASCRSHCNRALTMPVWIRCRSTARTGQRPVSRVAAARSSGSVCRSAAACIRRWEGEGAIRLRFAGGSADLRASRLDARAHCALRQASQHACCLLPGGDARPAGCGPACVVRPGCGWWRGATGGTTARSRVSNRWLTRPKRCSTVRIRASERSIHAPSPAAAVRTAVLRFEIGDRDYRRSDALAVR